MGSGGGDALPGLEAIEHLDLVPLHERNPKDKSVYSLIQAEVTRGGETKTIIEYYRPTEYMRSLIRV